jgi:hypothetical protein
MTAEIAIINRFGIALAADSAVTIGDERVWKTTNKLFSLGPNHDAAIMIYGGGTYLGCPWDTVIKQFREDTKNDEFNNIHEIVPRFFAFLGQSRWGTAEDDALSIVRLLVKELYEYAGSFEDLAIDKEKEARLGRLIDSETKSVKSSAQDFDIKLTVFKKIFRPYVWKLVDDIFDFKVSSQLKNRLLSYLYEYTVRSKNISNHETGIVFCGFGKSEIYPVLLETFLDGRFQGILRWWNARSYDFNMERDSLGIVVPFAQRDMTNIFMEGISHIFVQFFHTALTQLARLKSVKLVEKLVADNDEKKKILEQEAKVNRKIVQDTFDEFHSIRRSESIQPLMSAIRSLPREEMSAMAEALVELTSLRRKIDSRVQSVAGPVDVAFVSKGDGVIWMKRKLYFDSSINADYVMRRKQRLE